MDLPKAYRLGDTKTHTRWLTGNRYVKLTDKTGRDVFVIPNEFPNGRVHVEETYRFDYALPYIQERLGWHLQETRLIEPQPFQEPLPPPVPGRLKRFFLWLIGRPYRPLPQLPEARVVK